MWEWKCFGYFSSRTFTRPISYTTFILLIWSGMFCWGAQIEQSTMVLKQLRDLGDWILTSLPQALHPVCDRSESLTETNCGFFKTGPMSWRYRGGRGILKGAAVGDGENKYGRVQGPPSTKPAFCSPASYWGSCKTWRLIRMVTLT